MERVGGVGGVEGAKTITALHASSNDPVGALKTGAKFGASVFFSKPGKILVSQPETIKSIGMRDWAHDGQS
ncbi:hypothetical protein [Devosia sp.]|uniref:hypothetical protein n=1 Tax=Devosia sp. TaxID=1871048 RepID=UPI002AFDDD9A|nr:hypothetical protein [Devosia sp.]